MEGGIVAWGLSPSLVGLAQKTISQTRVPRVSFQRSSFVIAYLVCVTFDCVKEEEEEEDECGLFGYAKASGC